MKLEKNDFLKNWTRHDFNMTNSNEMEKKICYKTNAQILFQKV